MQASKENLEEERELDKLPKMIDIHRSFVNNEIMVDKLKVGVKLGKIKGHVDKNAMITFNENLTGRRMTREEYITQQESTYIEDRLKNAVEEKSISSISVARSNKKSREYYTSRTPVAQSNNYNKYSKYSVSLNMSITDDSNHSILQSTPKFSKRKLSSLTVK